MIEKGKSVLLFLLVAVSLVQSYFLAYSMPFMEAKERTELDYVKSEPLGTEEKIDKLIFPEQLIVHMGNDRHTVFYPSTRPYYGLILEKLQGRVFQGIQISPVNAVDWDEVRRENKGVELRFGRAVPFELLQRVFKINTDFVLSRDAIDRIWIYSSTGRDEVRTFFFSSDGKNVYESLRADLTTVDVEGYVGFGQYWDPYSSEDGLIYFPDNPFTRILEMQAGFSRYTTDQMQDNLFFDPGMTWNIEDSGFYTDGKRGLKVEQDGAWMTYTNPVAPTDSEDNLTDNIMSAVSYVNQHGGWNGRHLLVQEVESESGNAVRFQQYYKDVPLVSGSGLNFGYMQLVLEQGIVSAYHRSLLNLNNEISNKTGRELPGGDTLKSMISQASAGGMEIVSLFPAYRPTMQSDKIVLHPVWAARLDTGEVVVLAESAAVALR